MWACCPGSTRRLNREDDFCCFVFFGEAHLSKTSQIIFDLHPGFSHMEDEKGNKLHLFKQYFQKMMFFLLYKPSLVLIVIHLNRFLCDESFCKEKLKSKICGF